MKLPIALSILTLTALPSLAAVLRPRDDFNTVLVGYFNGERFVTQVLELHRADGILAGIANLDPFPFHPKEPTPIPPQDIYYAEILRGPPTVSCRFSQTRLTEPLASAFTRERLDHSYFWHDRPFRPYKGRYPGAVSLVCSTDRVDGRPWLDR